MKYAIIGFGPVGQALAKMFARRGIEVAVATRRPPEAIALAASEIGSIVVPSLLKDELAAEIILLAIPFWAHRDAKEICVELCPDLSLSRLFDSAQQRIARIVAHHVQPPEMDVSLRNDGFDLFTLRHVELQRQDRIAVFFSEAGKRRQGTGGGYDFVAPRQRALRPDAAKAA